MKLLLDTHVFLWFISGDCRLSNDPKGSIRDPDHEVYLSFVSVREAIIKYQLGRLPLPESPGSYSVTQIREDIV